METKLDGFTLKIVPDENPIDYWHDCEHLGKFLMWHRCCNLGDDNPFKEPEDFRDSEEAKLIYASLPVYMLDHSCLRLSCTDFADPWDSGWVGWVYCTETKAREWLGDECSPEAAAEAMKEEIERYDAFLNGTFYCFFVEGLNGEIEDSGGDFRFEGDFKALISDMRRYSDDRFAPLFDKLVSKMNRMAIM